MDKSLDIDLYQARMLIAFWLSGRAHIIGTMEAFTRKLPDNRKFLVVCGIPRIAEYIASLKFTENTIRVLKEVLPEIEFTNELCNYLYSINFAKELKVKTMADGDIAFEQEPVISITGPIGLVQYVETKILSILNHDIRIASKAARITLAANERPVAEFGSRRHADNMGPEAARAAYIGGFSSTSNVAAYEKYGIPVIGTMGHVWVMSYLDEESDAYNDWGKLFKNSVYLPDTYDTVDGVKKALNVCRGNVGGIRLDSGNLSDLSFRIRRELNNRDAFKTKIGATNDLDEYQIQELIENGNPIDWFGVGTKVVTTPDSPSCNFIYKLVEVDGEPIAKISSDSGKTTLPGAKQVFRHFSMVNDKLLFSGDTLALTNEKDDILHSVNMLHGIDLNALQPNINDSRNNFLKNIITMPQYLKSFTNDNIAYPVHRSKGLSDALRKFLLKHDSKY